MPRGRRPLWTIRVTGSDPVRYFAGFALSLGAAVACWTDDRESAEAFGSEADADEYAGRAAEASGERLESVRDGS